MFRRIAHAAIVFMLAAAPAPAQEIMSIAAVVNDRAISIFDLEMRINVVLYNANLARTEEMRQRVAGTVLRNLVDEALQFQEAEAKGIRITDREIEQAIARIEDSNNVPRGQLRTFLADRGIVLDALVGQIRSQIAWAKYVSQRVRPTVNVSEEEIDEELSRLDAMRGRPEFLVSEITLFHGSAESPGALEATAGSIVGQLRSGANFAGVAAQFSQGSLARNGGDLGWIQEGRSRPEVDRVLAALAVGEVSDPIRSPDGLHIILLRDKRLVMGDLEQPVRLFLSQILLPASADDTADVAAARLAEANEISAETEGCDALRARGAELEGSFSGDLGWVSLRDLPEIFQQALAALEVGAASEPLVTDNGVHVMMVCERDAPDAQADMRDRIYEQIATRRLASIERRLLRDLRRNAFIDLRI